MTGMNPMQLEEEPKQEIKCKLEIKIYNERKRKIIKTK
jgi:hypothetical protein